MIYDLFCKYIEEKRKFCKNWINGYFFKRSGKNWKSQGKQENIWKVMEKWRKCFDSDGIFFLKLESLSLMYLKIVFLIKNQCLFTLVCCFSWRWVKQTMFNQKWLEEGKFKSWLVSSKNDDKSKCRQCKEVIDLSNIGRHALLSHFNSKKQKGNDIKMK